jgi:hypothetical protein
MTRLAVVSYAVAASPEGKRRACLEGLEECAARALEHGATVPEVVARLEQVGNDAEQGELS